MAKRYEMLWDCPRCDTPKLLGLTHRHCPNCGAPQDPSRRYYPKEEDKVAVEDHPLVGADKACPACDAPNAANAHFCGTCGSPMEGAKTVEKREAQTAKGGFATDSARAAEEERAKKKAPPPPPPTKSGLGLFVGLGVLAMGVLLCAGIAFFFLAKKEAGVVVTGHTWSRTIAVERFDAVTDSAWRDQLPSDARGVSCTQEKRSTKKVEDGQDCHTKREDHGDGTFTEKEECTPKYREEPVYDDKCTFTADRWKKVRDEKAQGTSLADAPRWPAAPITGAGATLGAEREAGRTEVYSVHFKDDEGRDLSCDLPEGSWSKIADGSRWRAPVGTFSASIDCSALAPG